MSEPAADARFRAVLGWLTVLAAGCYSLFVIAPVFGSRLDPGTSYVSELAALDQPASVVFRVGDLVVGVVIVVAGVVFAGGGGRRRLQVGFWFAVLGVCTVWDPLVPMPCAPSAEPRCPEGGVSAAGELVVGPHEVVSVLGNVAAIMAMATLAWSWWSRRRSGTRTSVLEMIGAVGLPVTALTGLVAVLEATVLVLSDLGSWVGWAQRVQVLTISLVLAALGAHLGREPVARPGAERMS